MWISWDKAENGKQVENFALTTQNYLYKCAFVSPAVGQSSDG